MYLRTLIHHEEQILQDSLQNNVGIIANVEDLIMLLSEVVLSEDNGAVSFYFLSNQVKHDLLLCLLSSLRSLETQSKLMKRQAIEKACLAVYSLFEPELDKFLSQDEDGAKPVQKALDRSFKYIQKNFPVHSYRLKQVKDMINNFYAHGSMFNSLRKDDHLGFFDKHTPFSQRVLIWEVGHLAVVIFDMWYHAAKQSAYVKQNEQSYREFVQAKAINQKYREEFANHEIFKKWRPGV